jgi:hypothetical protein
MMDATVAWPNDQTFETGAFRAPSLGRPLRVAGVARM